MSVHPVTTMPSWLKRVRTIFRRASMERELDAELRFHLDMQTAEYVRQGARPEVARRERAAALRRRRGHQRRRPRHLADAAGRNLLAGRPLRRPQPAQAGRLRPRRRRHDGARHRRQHRHLQRRQRRRPAAAALRARRGSPALESGAQRRRQHRLLTSSTSTTSSRRPTSLDAVVEYHNMYFILLGGDEPERVAAGVVSWDYFQTLGVTPLLGRTFRAEDDAHDAARDDRAEPRVLAARLRRHIGTSIGRVVEMNDRPHTIVGVLPDVPMYPQPNDVYMPRSACPFRMSPGDRERRGSGMASAIGRRRPGLSLDRREADLAEVGQRLQAAYPASYRADRGYQLDRQSAAPRVHAGLRIDAPHPREHRRLRAPHRVRERRQPGRRADDAARPGACAAHGARREPRAAAATVVHREPDPRARRRRGRAAARVRRAWICWSSTPRVSRRGRPRSGSTRPCCSSRWRYRS